MTDINFYFNSDSNQEEDVSLDRVKNLFKSDMQEHLEVAAKTLETLETPFYRLLDICLKSVRQGGKILFFGNGGSAADAQHLATELTVRFSKSRPAIPALALTTDSSALTAIANDFSFEDLFSRQIEALGRPGDIALGISTSAQSPNILKALKVASEKGLTPVGFAGKEGGKMIGLADPLLIVPSQTTARIQEMHITLGQMLCAGLEQGLGLV
tara:strand:+ start:238 stop:876 length:639 start_codon:yes stop_codon:yes gene_type:complete